MSTAYIDDARFLEHETGYHPETPLRLDAIRRAMENDAELWSRLRHVTPEPARDEDITRCHSPQLIDRVREAAEFGPVQLDPDTAVSRKSFEVARLAAGAALGGVDRVLTGDTETAFASVRPPGHHARPDRAMGFCLFNNVAIAARYAQSRYGVERVLVVDWDVHHGNGTQEIFYRDPSVFYFSVHQYPFFPGTGAAAETGEGLGSGTTLNVPLRARTPASAHRQAFSGALREVEKRFHPDLVLISAGFDARRDDLLGGLLLDDADFADMTKEVLDLAARHARGRVVSLLEGGYNLQNLGRSVHVHVKALSEDV